MQKIYYTKKD